SMKCSAGSRRSLNEICQPRRSWSGSSPLPPPLPPIRTTASQSPIGAPVTLIKPFRALRPATGRAAEILAPPYHVLSSSESRELAKGKPLSFLHVSKPEIDLDPTIDPYDRAVYAKAAENFQHMIKIGALIRDPKPCYYVYRLTRQGHAQTGLAAV